MIGVVVRGQGFGMAACIVSTVRLGDPERFAAYACAVLESPSSLRR